MAPYYEQVCKDLGWTVDQTLLANMKAENAKTLEELDKKIKDAEENLGDTDVRDLMINRAEHFSRIGHKVNSYAV